MGKPPETTIGNFLPTCQPGKKQRNRSVRWQLSAPPPVSRGMTLPEDIDEKLIMQGVHVHLTDAMQRSIRDRFAVLLRHNPWIVRINVRLHRDQKLGKGQQHHYTATGQIEIGGPDLVASAENQAAYDALDALVGKLDRLLRERAGRRKDKRNHPHEVELESELPKTRPS